MKFTGLILICATSALALLLPALGMVKFPMVDVRSESSVAIDPSAPPGLPVATPGLSGGMPSSPTDSSTAPTTAPSAPASLLGPPWTRQKLSLNAWLMLGPVMLLGIGLWTLAPNRGGLGR
jgi:hypothetical protein